MRTREAKRRESEVVSTVASSPAPQSPWKQEVNRRLAEHKNRKGSSVADEDALVEAQGLKNGRAAQAAARVAARYANTPSFSEMQAAEARAALRAAEAATRAALEAQAAAQAALDYLHTAEEEHTEREEQAPKDGAQRSSVQQARQAYEHQPQHWANQKIQIRWDPEMPAFPVANSQMAARPLNRVDQWHTPDSDDEALSLGPHIEEVEPAQTIPANLIQFPRELIATRRMRPRLTDVQSGASGAMDSQLSIFEVDPGSISTDPELPDAARESAEAWNSYDWSAIELDSQPQVEPEHYADTAAENTPTLHQAPFGFRVMAIVVDAALIVGTVCGLAALTAAKLPHLPSMKMAELGAAGALILVSVLYQYLFLRVGWDTPGMRWAGVSLCTFDDENPTREELRLRWRAMLFSLLPMGLGMLWAIFDADNMSWHDRHSKTYLRKY